jgi:HEAT repeats
MSELSDVAAAGHPDWRVRLRAVRVLSSREDPAARQALEGLLDDPDTAVVDATSEALVESGGIDGLAVALRNLDHPDLEFGDNFNMLLQFWAGSGRFPIRDWLRVLSVSEDASTQRRASEALAWLGSRET